ncbi:trafficking kinesin-binding protein 2 isoform 1-T3 [Vipera latastei]
MNFNHSNSENITDVCPNEDLPEVELVSMLEEQLPQYKLRVDSLYLPVNDDWIQSRSSHSHDPEISSPVLAEEALHYMIVGTDRGEYVPKNCNDIEVITHLLAEKDRDLELAARIGQALLRRNHSLTEQNDVLEDQLGQAFDKIHQLQHELTKKDELLRVVSTASEESETDSSCSTPLRFNESFNLSQGFLQLDILQDKLRELEEENLLLRTKACHLKTETMTYEDKEHQLVTDCVKEIKETNAQIARMSEELMRKDEELIHYQEEISSLLSQIVDLQHKIKEHVIEKEELKLHLQASKDAQKQLTAELHEVQERNVECLGMLHESQEEVKGLRSKTSQAALYCRPQLCGAFPVESLAAEIEGTMRKVLSLDEESLSKQKIQQKRIFDTVKLANDMRGRSASCPVSLSIPGSNRSSVVMTAKPFHSGLQYVEGKGPQTLKASPEDVSKETQKLSHAGIPSEDDVATALHKLNLRCQNYLSEKWFFEEEWKRKILLLDDQKEELTGCSTPVENCFSVNSSSERADFSGSSTSMRSLLPEKLQIVKPLEGSQTLFHWQQLAQPNLGTILDPRPGVVTKDFAPLSQEDVYYLSDLEEDEEERDEGITFQVQPSLQEESKQTVPKSVPGIFLPPVKLATVPHTASNPGKCLSSTNSTFTFTTCRILHPSDITQVTPSTLYSPLCSGSCSSTSSVITSVPPMLYKLSTGEFLTNRRDSTTTFSSTRSLAKLLQERGISATVYNSPVQLEAPLLHHSKIPAVPLTPPNSPLHSPCSSSSSFESRASVSENFLASRPAETLLHELYGQKPSNPSDARQLKINLVERLKKLGIARAVKQPEAGGYRKSQRESSCLRRQGSGVYVSPGSNLMGGLRRNHSLPVLIGALAGPVSTSSTTMGVLKED